MRYFLCALFFLILVTSSFCQADTTSKPQKDTIPQETGDPNFGNDNGQDGGNGTLATTGQSDQTEKFNVIEALLSYNFSSNNKGLKNLTPVINYGWMRDFFKKTEIVNGEKIDIFKWRFSINPYAAGQIDVKDSGSYIPALMLPGIAGLRINSFLYFKVGKGNLILAPLNFGFKLFSNFSDSSMTIAQHNIRSFLGFTYNDLFQMGVQYTYGWHNSTSESEKIYRQLFSLHATDIQYLTISLETRLSQQSSNKPMYFFAEWRGLLNKSRFSPFDNTKIITFGVRSSMDIENLAPAKRASRNR